MESICYKVSGGSAAARACDDITERLPGSVFMAGSDTGTIHVTLTPHPSFLGYEDLWRRECGRHIRAIASKYGVTIEEAKPVVSRHQHTIQLDTDGTPYTPSHLHAA